LVRARTQFHADENLEPCAQADQHERGQKQESATEEAEARTSYHGDDGTDTKTARDERAPDRQKRSTAAIGYENIAQTPYSLNEYGLGGIGFDQISRLRKLIEPNPSKPVFSLNEYGLGGIGFDQFAQTRNLHVQAAIESFVLAAARKFHQFIARQGDLGVTSEYFKYRKFTCGDGDLFAIAGQGARRQIERVGTEGDRLVFLTRGTGMLFGATAAQNGIDARQQFTRVEGFGEVIVGTHLQPDDSVDFLGLRGQHDDRGVIVPPAQSAADGQAIFARQHQIQHEKVEMLPRPQLAHLLSILGDEYVEALFGEVAPQQVTQSRIIVDDKDFAGRCGVLSIHGSKCNSERAHRIVGIHKILHIACGPASRNFDSRPVGLFLSPFFVQFDRL